MTPDICRLLIFHSRNSTDLHHQPPLHPLNGWARAPPTSRGESFRRRRPPASTSSVQMGGWSHDKDTPNRSDHMSSPREGCICKHYITIILKVNPSPFRRLQSPRTDLKAERESKPRAKTRSPKPSRMSSVS